MSPSGPLFTRCHCTNNNYSRLAKTEKKQQHSHKRSFLIRISLWVYVYERRGSPPSAIFANLSNIMKSCVKLVFHMGIRSAGAYQACRFNIIIMQVELSDYAASYLFRFRILYIHKRELSVPSVFWL